MPSPFPGMDPFLEVSRLFEDFHSKFINYLQEFLADLVSEQYDVRVREKVYLVHSDEDDTVLAKRIEPDVAVTSRDLSGGSVATIESVSILEPVVIPLVSPGTVRETYIEILHRDSQSLVTSIELLSPSNKDARGRALYDEKRQSVLLQPVHLVELDLLFHGQRMTFARRLPPGDYYAMVSRAEKRPLCDVYAWSVRQRLPLIPIPLKQPDPDVMIDLQAVFETTFERGRYARSIDYAADFAENTTPETREWIEHRARGSQAPPDSAKTPPNE